MQQNRASPREYPLLYPPESLVLRCFLSNYFWDFLNTIDKINIEIVIIK
jgi:hypothetical protein